MGSADAAEPVAAHLARLTVEGLDARPALAGSAVAAGSTLVRRLAHRGVGVARGAFRLLAPADDAYAVLADAAFAVADGVVGQRIAAHGLQIARLAERIRTTRGIGNTDTVLADAANLQSRFARKAVSARIRSAHSAEADAAGTGIAGQPAQMAVGAGVHDAGQSRGVAVLALVPEFAHGDVGVARALEAPTALPAARFEVVVWNAGQGIGVAGLTRLRAEGAVRLTLAASTHAAFGARFVFISRNARQVGVAGLAYRAQREVRVTLIAEATPTLPAAAEIATATATDRGARPTRRPGRTRRTRAPAHKGQ
jgi:hypothetical protein